MPPRKRFSGIQLCQLLEQPTENLKLTGDYRLTTENFQLAPDSTITVPVPLHKDLKPGTLASIIRQSQLDRSLFE